MQRTQEICYFNASNALFFSCYLTCGEVVYFTQSLILFPLNRIFLCEFLPKLCHAGSETRPQRVFAGLQLRF